MKHNETEVAAVLLLLAAGQAFLGQPEHTTASKRIWAVDPKEAESLVFLGACWELADRHIGNEQNTRSQSDACSAERLDECLIGPGGRLMQRLRRFGFAKNHNPGVTSLGRREGLLLGLAPLAEVGSRERFWDSNGESSRINMGTGWCRYVKVIPQVIIMIHLLWQQVK